MPSVISQCLSQKKKIWLSRLVGGGPLGGGKRETGGGLLKRDSSFPLFIIRAYNLQSCLNQLYPQSVM